MSKMNNYIVVWTPDTFPCAVSDMRVIDAFGSTGTMADARRYVYEHVESYRDKHGAGDVRVFKSNTPTAYI